MKKRFSTPSTQKGRRRFSTRSTSAADDRRAGLPPLHPAGLHQLLIRSGTQIEGAEVVVVGRSNIVGKPIANMPIQKAPALMPPSPSATPRRVIWPSIPGGPIFSSWGRPSQGRHRRHGQGVVTVIDVGVNEIGKTAEGKRILAVTSISIPSRRRPGH
jgi:methylenetetrahydrofolate dehydrogenase (NADP+)/methenyltetrahydrofolate cyclohydrolase